MWISLLCSSVASRDNFFLRGIIFLCPTQFTHLQGGAKTKSGNATIPYTPKKPMTNNFKSGLSRASPVRTARFSPLKSQKKIELLQLSCFFCACLSLFFRSTNQNNRTTVRRLRKKHLYNFLTFRNRQTYWLSTIQCLNVNRVCWT